MEALKDPAELEKANRQMIIRDLNDVQNSVEKLVNRTYMEKATDLNFQLRNIKSSVSQLLADIKNRNLDGFSGRKGTLNEFYNEENILIRDSARISDIFSSLINSTEPIDIFMLEDMLDGFKKRFNERIRVDKDIQKEFKLKQIEALSAERVSSGERPEPVKKATRTLTSMNRSEKTDDTNSISRTILAPSTGPESPETGVKEQTGKENIGTDVLSKLYNYMNVLEHKYSTSRPELSFSGDYIGNKKWKFSVSDRSISGTIMESIVRPFMTFETYWHPFDDLRAIMGFVQREANNVPAGQYKSLCLLSSTWSDEIRQWAQSYVHPRLMIYLVDLRTNEIHFNIGVRNSERLKVWHDQEAYVTLEEEIIPLVDQDEAFEAADVAKATGLSTEGAKKLIIELLSKNKIIDVGFGTSRYSGIKNR